jgi:hypothetical protein
MASLKDGVSGCCFCGDWLSGDSPRALLPVSLVTARRLVRKLMKALGLTTKNIRQIAGRWANKMVDLLPVGQTT